MRLHDIMSDRNHNFQLKHKQASVRDGLKQYIHLIQCNLELLIYYPQCSSDFRGLE